MARSSASCKARRLGILKALDLGAKPTDFSDAGGVLVAHLEARIAPLVRQRREGRYPCCGIEKRTGEFRWAGKRHPVGLGRVLIINQSGETLGLTVRFAPNSGAKADILGPPLRATSGLTRRNKGAYFAR